MRRERTEGPSRQRRLQTGAVKLCVGAMRGQGQIQCPPDPVNAASAVAVGDQIFLFGGRSGIGMGEGDTNQLIAFDTKNYHWSKVDTKGDHPCSRSYHAMTGNGKMLYVFGGCGASGRMSDLYSFDTSNSTWEKLPQSDVIEGRGGAGLAYCGGKVYVIGGFAGREMNDVHEYDVESKKWSQVVFDVPFPPRSVFGVAVLDDVIVTICGEVDPSDKGHAGAGHFSNECYAWKTSEKEKKWQKLGLADDVVPEPRGWFPAAVVARDKNVLIFGGNSLTNERLNDTYLMKFD